MYLVNHWFYKQNNDQEDLVEHLEIEDTAKVNQMIKEGKSGESNVKV